MISGVPSEHIEQKTLSKTPVRGRGESDLPRNLLKKSFNAMILDNRLGEMRRCVLHACQSIS